MATRDPNFNHSNSNPEILDGIVEHFTKQLRAGKHPSIESYQNRHPDLRDEIEDLLASVAMIEQLKSNPNSPSARNRRSLDEASRLKQIGDYRITHEIGRGGAGIVFEAVHDLLGQRVAIKVMPTPLVNSEKHVERFKRESQSAAKLHHTNIVSVFGVGETEGFHYYVMNLIDGQTLSDVIFGLAHSIQSNTTVHVPDSTQLEALAGPDQDPSLAGDRTDGFAGDETRNDSLSAGNQLPSTSLDSSMFSVEPIARGPSRDIRHVARQLDSRHFRWAARLGANLADALAYAHDAKILHRDIKPSNVLLDRKGVVWITDFGLAKDGSHEINLTKTGDVIGTPQYLAPESLEGKYDCRSEIYCLGLTLYELVTLQTAYPAGTTAEVIRAIATTSPVSVRKLNSRIPIDLSTIIDKALCRDPQSRYQTADEIRNDLTAFVEDRPISARAPSAVELAIKWGRRNPLAAALTGVSISLLLLVAVSASVGYLYTVDALGKEADKSTRLKIQQIETEKQRRAAVDAQKSSEEFAAKMKAQFDRAESNIAITLEAFDTMFKQVVSRGTSTVGEFKMDGFEELTGIATSVTREDARFLEELLAFYDKFATQNKDNDSLKVESARAFRRVANIYQLVGDFQRSRESYRQATALYEQALAQSPDTNSLLIALVQTKNEWSRVCRKDRSSRESIRQAVKQNEEAIALLEDVPTGRLDDAMKLEMAKSLNSLGSSAALTSVMFSSASDTRDRTGQRPRAEPNRGVPQWLNRFLGPPKPNAERPRPDGDRRPRNLNRDPAPQPRDRSPRGSRRGERFFERSLNGNASVGRRAKIHSSQAIEILTPLIEHSPDNLEFRSVRANCYCSLATIMLIPEPDKAIKMRDMAIDELESLILLDPENPSFQYRLALVCSLGNSQTPTDMDRLQQSVRIATDLQDNFPRVLDYQYLLGSVRNKLAGKLIKKGDLQAALDSLKIAKSSFEQVIDQAPSDRSNQITLQVLGSQLRALIDACIKERKPNSKIAREAKGMIAELRLRHERRPPPPKKTPGNERRTSNLEPESNSRSRN